MAEKIKNINKPISSKKSVAEKKVLKKTSVTLPNKSKTSQVKLPANHSATSKSKTTSKNGTYEKVRFKLIRQKETILSEAETAMNALPDQTIFPDLGDQASVESDRNFMLRLRGREQRLLKKIDEALDRIEKGTFGICDVCGDAISLQRLEARPVTTMCINCKTEQEADEKLKGD